MRQEYKSSGEVLKSDFQRLICKSYYDSVKNMARKICSVLLPIAVSSLFFPNFSPANLSSFTSEINNILPISRRAAAETEIV